MKNLFSIVAVAALTTAFVACGPSKEEMEKREQAKQDSIAAVEKAKAQKNANYIAYLEKQGYVVLTKAEAEELETLPQ